MNAIVTTGGNALMPTNMEGAMRLAEMMARGKLVPQHLHNSPGDCLMIIEQAARWGMSPFAVAQCTGLVKGKLSYEGKLVAAAIHTSGILVGRLDYEFSGAGADRKVIASGLMRGEEKPRSVEVTLASAKTDNEHWRKSPDQMLTYHAARVWARRHAPEVMLGVYSPEEFEQPRDNFTGTMLDAEPVPQGQPRDTARAIGDELPPSATSAAPKRQTIAEWLLVIQADLEGAQTGDAVDLIVTSEKVQKALDTLTNGALHTLNGLIYKAQARTAADPPATEDTWPGPTPESMRADREAAA